MRRYELMLVLRPDTADDRVQQILDRTTRGIAASEGQIVKVSPWGRRRLAYPISSFREGSYFIVVFDAPSDAITELERGLNITEEVMRHLVTRIERPATTRRPDRRDDDREMSDADMTDDGEEPKAAEDAGGESSAAEIPAETTADILPPPEDEPEPESEVIDESESEAAPKATG